MKTCPNCGGMSDNQANVCTYCGFRFQNANQNQSYYQTIPKTGEVYPAPQKNPPDYYQTQQYQQNVYQSQTKKKKTGCLIAAAIPVGLILIIILIVLFIPTKNTNSSDYTHKSSIESQNQKEAQESKQKDAYVIQNQVIVDNDVCSFSIISVTEGSFWNDIEINVFCENKTSNKTLMFSWEDVSVMGYMIDPFWAESVAPGKKSNTTISFSHSQLDPYGIDRIDEIIFELSVSDNDDFGVEPYVKNFYTIYPTGENSETIQYPVISLSESAVSVVDNANIKFIIQSVEKDSIWGYTVNCYIQNNTNKKLMFSWDDVSVNGFMCDPFWGNTLMPGKGELVEISFSDSDFEKNNITDVESIEFRLSVHNADDYSEDSIVDQVFTFSPNVN